MNAVVQIADLLLHRPARFFGSVLPVILVMMLLLLANMPLSFSAGALPAPILALGGIYFWSLVRGDLMPPSAVLALGLLEDLLSGGPAGLWAAGFLAAYALIYRQREVFASLSGVGSLFGFASAMFVAGATAYALDSLVYLRLTSIPPLLLAGVTTVAVYPFVAFAMQWFYRTLVGPLRNGA